MLYARTLFLYSYTFTRSSDSLDLHIQILNILFYWSGLDETGHVPRSWSFFLSILVLLSSFYSRWLYSFPDSLYITISRYSFSVFIWYHVWISICSIAVILIYRAGLFIPCSGYFRLNVYVGYSPRVYTSPTLAVTPFSSILGSGAWQILLCCKEDLRL